MKAYFRILTIIVLGISTILMAQNNPATEGKITAKLQHRMERVSANDIITAWIFFTDKGSNPTQKLDEVEKNLLPESYERRLRNRPAEKLVDMYDVPVEKAYIKQISPLVSKVRHKSRWLNAVSVEASREALEHIAGLSFVKKIDLVFQKTEPVKDRIEDLPAKSQQPAGTESLNYGPSFDQNNQIKVPALHNMGYDGSGVIVAMLDAGFINLEHEALQHLDILHTWDFVNGDSIVDDEPGQMGSGYHGTYTLSTLAGFKEGELIGPAYGASFLLAKTENTDYERHIEEDNWVAGAEWADSLGADIISSSLGYRDGFTPPDTNYTWEDMDGNTTIVTIGADIAASRGILVVNSAGNEGPASGNINTIIAPADGDSVLAIGAVNSSGTRANFSSMGPTADGRIKPDVVARGVDTYCASPWTSGYSGVSGTSLSCPLVAGAAALVLQANPNFSNMDIINAFKNTASQSQNPDNEYGWGIINTYDAAFYLTGISTGEEPIVTGYQLLANYPNPFNPETTIRYQVKNSGKVKLAVFNSLGQKVADLDNNYRAAGSYQLTWNAENLASGIYYIVLETPRNRAVQKALLMK
ncbi:MAG: S8 family serine peptidase [Anaerolineales bacterium]